MGIKFTWQRVVLVFFLLGQAAQFLVPTWKWLGTPFALMAIIVIIGGDELDAWSMVTLSSVHAPLDHSFR